MLFASTGKLRSKHLDALRYRRVATGLCPGSTIKHTRLRAERAHCDTTFIQSPICAYGSCAHKPATLHPSAMLGVCAWSMPTSRASKSMLVHALATRRDLLRTSAAIGGLGAAPAPASCQIRRASERLRSRRSSGHSPAGRQLGHGWWLPQTHRAPPQCASGALTRKQPALAENLAAACASSTANGSACVSA